MAAMPALAMAGAGAVAGAAPGGAAGHGPSIGSWLKAGISQAGLAPITIDRMPAGRKKPAMFPRRRRDSKPYALAKPVRRSPAAGGAQANRPIVKVWRRQLGGVQKLFRKINQAAYLVSVPFLMILVFGTVVGNRPMALLGATAVVLLNIGRLVAGAANLAVVPLRDGINFEQDEEAARPRDRAGRDDRPGGPGVHLHPLALQRSGRRGEHRRAHPLRRRGPQEGHEGRGRPGRRRRQARRRRRRSSRSSATRPRTSTSRSSAHRPRRSSRSSATRPRRSTSRSSVRRRRRSSRNSVRHQAAARPS